MKLTAAYTTVKVSYHMPLSRDALSQMPDYTRAEDLDTPLSEDLTEQFPPEELTADEGKVTSWGSAQVL